MRFRYLILVLFASFSGCAMMMPPYVDPLPSEANAKMRFTSSSAKNVGIWVEVFEGEKDGKCYGGKLVSVMSHSRGIENDQTKARWRQNLNLPLGSDIPAEEKVEIAIPAGKPLFFTMGDRTGSSCVITAQFLPKENGVYEATYLSKNYQCTMAVSKIVEKDSGFLREREPSVTQRNAACLIII